MSELFDSSYCVKCGACKAPCPTHELDFDETMTARGRIRLLVALEEGRLLPTRELRRRISTCVLCGRCEDRCPVGVDVMEIIYRGRQRLFGGNKLTRFLGSQFLSPSAADRFMRWARRLQGPASALLAVRGKNRFLPPFPAVPFRLENQVFKGKRPRGRVAFFVGCAVNYLYPEIGDDVVAVLLHLGYEVVAIRGEVCCGAPHRESGHEDLAVQLARKNVELFEKIQAEAIVTACPTCALTLKAQYPRMLAGAASVADQVEDITGFLARRLDLSVGDAGLGTVAYHDPCHLLHGLGVKAEPRKLLGAAGATVAELGREPSCCGFGGMFGFAHYDLSRRIGEQRCREVEAAAVEHVVTSCPGCMLQFQDALKGRGTRIWHTVEVLRRALEEKTGGDTEDPR